MKTAEVKKYFSQISEELSMKDLIETLNDEAKKRRREEELRLKEKAERLMNATEFKLYLRWSPFFSKFARENAKERARQQSRLR